MLIIQNGVRYQICRVAEFCLLTGSGVTYDKFNVYCHTLFVFIE